MADNEVNVRLISAVKPTTAWANNTTTARAGEMLYGTNASGVVEEIKVGDGSKKYSELPAASIKPYTGTAPITVSGNAISHNVSGVTSGSYGSATSVAQITVDAKGHVTSAKNVAISFPTDKHTYLTSANFTNTPSSADVEIKIVTSGTSGATAKTTVAGATTTNAGVMTTAQVSKLTGIADNANKVEIAESTQNGKIKVTTNGSASNVSIHGLGSAAYTNSDSYISTGSRTTAITTSPASNSTSVPTDYAVKTYVDSKVSTSFQTTVVTALPSSGSANTVYFVKGSGETKSKEYMWIDGAWDLIGDTSIDPGVTSITANNGIVASTSTGAVTLSADLRTTTKFSAAGTTGAASASKVYAVQMDKNSDLAVAVPWTDNDHKYTLGDGVVTQTSSALSVAIALTGTSGDSSTSTTTLPVYVGATTSVAGKRGIVPAPGTADTKKVLVGDGSWVALDHTYVDVSGATVSSASNANNASNLGGSAASTYLQADDVVKGNGISVSTASGKTTVSANLKTATKTTIAGTTGAGASQVYAVQMDKDGYLAVAVPWSAGANYYTTAMQQTTSSTTFSATVKGNNNAVAGNFSIPEGTESVAGVSSTVSTDRLRNGTKTLILNGNFA